MPADLSMIHAWTAGYEPMARGIDHTPMHGLEGLPGSSNPIIGTLAPFMAPHAQNWMNEVGMTPLGLSGRNASHVMQNMRTTEHNDEIMRRMAERDRDSLMRTMKAADRLTGGKWDADKEKGAKSVADSFVAMSPTIGMMSPDVMDAMTGGTSAGGLTAGVIKGSRYRQDPLTGMPSMSLDQTTAMAEGLHAAYFEGGKFDRAKNAGFTSGQLGTMYDELSRRGMLAGGDGKTTALGGLSMLESARGDNFQKLVTNQLGEARAKEAFAAAKSSGTDVTAQLSLAEANKLAATQEGGDAIKAFDVSRVKTTMDKYKGSLAAMRDIFGDAGHPDAPMPQLFKALEAMTNGSLQTMDPKKAEMMVRRMAETAKSAGIGLEGQIQIQQHAAQVAQQFGLSPQATPGLTMEILTATAAAQKSGMGSINQWGAMNVEQLGQAAGTRTASAMKSDMANRLGAIANLEKRMQQVDGKGFAADSNMGKVLEAVREGKTTFEHVADDGTRSVKNVAEFMSRENMSQITEELKKSSGGRFTDRDLFRQEQDRFANEERIVKEDIGETVARMQVGEAARKTVAPRIKTDLANTLRTKAGMSHDEVSAKDKELKAVSEDIGNYILTSTDEDEIKIGKISDKLKASGLYGNVSDAEVRYLAAAQLSTTNTALSDAGLQNRVAFSQQNNEQMTLGVDAERMQSSIRARKASSLTGLGQNTSMIQRFVQAAQKHAVDSDDPQALRKAFSEAVGGVDSAELATTLHGHLKQFGEAQASFDKLADEQLKLGMDEKVLDSDKPEEKLRKETANEARRKNRESYEQASRQLEDAKTTLGSEMRKHGGLSSALDGTGAATDAAKAAAPESSASAGVSGAATSALREAAKTAGVDVTIPEVAKAIDAMASVPGRTADAAAAERGAPVSAERTAAVAANVTTTAGATGPQKIQLEGTLLVKRDGTATIEGSGTPRGSVPTGVT